MRSGFASFREKILNPLKFRLFMLNSLPAAFFAGVRVKTLNEGVSVVTVRYKWFTKNPFRSMYFAVQSMAAEMSTGLLASGHIYKSDHAVSMLVVGLEARFIKKATDLVSFTCAEGEAILHQIEEAIATGEPRTIRCRSEGTNIAGEIVSEFFITWSFKTKAK